jgi:hypothetical protein
MVILYSELCPLLQWRYLKVQLGSYNEVINNGLSVLGGLSLASQVSSEVLLLPHDFEHGVLDGGGVSVELHALKHHGGREQQGSGVRLVLPCNVRRSPVHRLIDLTIEANVARSCEPKPTDQACTEIGNDVTVKIGHDHDVESRRTVGKMHADSVDLFLPVLDSGVVDGNLFGSIDEQSITHLHDSSLMASHD